MKIITLGFLLVCIGILVIKARDDFSDSVDDNYSYSLFSFTQDVVASLSEVFISP